MIWQFQLNQEPGYERPAFCSEIRATTYGEQFAHSDNCTATYGWIKEPLKHQYSTGVNIANNMEERCDIKNLSHYRKPLSEYSEHYKTTNDIAFGDRAVTSKHREIFNLKSDVYPHFQNELVPIKDSYDLDQWLTVDKRAIKAVESIPNYCYPLTKEVHCQTSGPNVSAKMGIQKKNNGHHPNCSWYKGIADIICKCPTYNCDTRKTS